MASHPIYQFYAELDDYTPAIWRRFQTAGNVSVARLGYIVMTLFEMQASHLFAFELVADEEAYGEELRRRDPAFRTYRFELPDDESFAQQNDRYELFDAAKIKISGVPNSPGTRLNFNYDFGDDWWISLSLESVFFDKELDGRELPRVLEGAGYGIVEDCGGTPGLERLAKAFKKKRGREYKEFREWLGVDLDMSAFDIDDINFRLKKVPRIYADLYERDLPPTKRSIDLLERKYLVKPKRG